MELLNFGVVLQAKYVTWLAAGAAMALGLFAASWIAGFVIALMLLALRESGVRLFEAFTQAFVAYHRNVPQLVQVFLWYFGVPQLLPDSWQAWINAHNSEFVLVWIALSLNSAAYMSEDLRSGLRSLPHTQLEAARALGMTYLQSMRIVLIPQALRAAFPPLVNQSLSLFKSTSLAMTVGLAEVTYASRQIENETYRTFEAFALASAFYWICSFVLTAVGHYWSERLKIAGKGA
ncbi:amino acids ABC transporter permease [Bordetella ansorpii]|uniref:Amino acids ABC transporter permease n=1 Tax=Bordetella ansorpii TaxID=288768 RepID=A0A157SGM5_9BORD|nr:amino acid ABC transporter permease [Bordetella ansorpii]SAI69632.1 amino acids ABC transporter permease [Bordetella ansorpii]